MNSSIAYSIVTSTPDLLILRELPYSVAGWLALFSGLFMGLIAVFTHWRFGSSRTNLLALLVGAGVCTLLGVWLIGLQYEFSFMRRQAMIELRMSWFGRTISDERLAYTIPPVAELVTTEGTTQQLVLRFSDGRVKTLGLSTDRGGHDEVVQLINHFLQIGSLL